MGLKLNDSRVYEPQIRARLGTTAHFCKVVVPRELCWGSVSHGGWFISAKVFIIWHNEMFYTNALILLVCPNHVAVFVGQRQLINTFVKIRAVRGGQRGRPCGACPRKVDVRLAGKGDSNSHGARPDHLIITMIEWIRTSRFSIKNSLSGACRPARGGPAASQGHLAHQKQHTPRTLQ